jgi:hypothetical protein
MLKNNEKRNIITRQVGSKVEYLMHQGHQHFWTADRSLAMTYTKASVADALAEKMGGQTTVAGPKD